MKVNLKSKYLSEKARVTLYAIDHNLAPFPVVGRRAGMNGPITTRWTLEGKHISGFPQYDLVEDSPQELEIVLNLYPCGRAAVYESQAEADLNADDRRIACITRSLSYKIGEGLSADEAKYARKVMEDQRELETQWMEDMR